MIVTPTNSDTEEVGREPDRRGWVLAEAVGSRIAGTEKGVQRTKDIHDWEKEGQDCPAWPTEIVQAAHEDGKAEDDQRDQDDNFRNAPIRTRQGQGVEPAVQAEDGKIEKPAEEKVTPIEPTTE